MNVHSSPLAANHHRPTTTMLQKLPIFSPLAWSRWFQTATQSACFSPPPSYSSPSHGFSTYSSSDPKRPTYPSCPLGLHLVGNLPFLDTETHSPILTLRLGNKIGVVITSPAAVREVLKDHDVAGREAAPTSFGPRTAPSGGCGGRSAPSKCSATPRSTPFTPSAGESSGGR